MPGTQVAAELEVFLGEVTKAERAVLLLDYDGTLAPFSPNHFSAYPYPGVRRALARIMGNGRTRVVVMSGRPAREVIRLLGVVPFPEIWGVHGLERLRTDGSCDAVPLGKPELFTLAEARSSLEKLGLLSLAEFKTGSIAVHWRGRTADEIASIRKQVRGAWTTVPALRRTVIQEFDGGIEIRAANRNKGDAVRTVLGELRGHVPVAYLGDDQTDEDAFRVLRGRGLGILVREEWRETKADVWIKPPEELLAFLRGWLLACGGTA